MTLLANVLDVSPLTGLLGVIFTAGTALVIGAWYRGRDLRRSGIQRSEARAFRHLERIGKAAERRAIESDKRSAYRAELVDYWRGRAGDLEYVIKTTKGLGPRAVPPLAPMPAPPEEIPESAADTKLLDEARSDD